MEPRPRQPLTKEKIVGMQVIDPDGYIVGKVKDISLCVGEMDQALVIETNEGEEEIRRWSEVSGVGDLILLKPAVPAPASPSPASFPGALGTSSPPAQAMGALHCGSCGAALEPNAAFCGSCGKRIG